MARPTASRDERGAVFVEKLIVYLPLLMMFFAAWELAEFTAASIVVQRASAAAGRAAMVVLGDDPAFYDGEPTGTYDGQRRADIELAAGMILSAIPRLSEDFEVDIPETPSQLGDSFEVSVAASYDCGLVSLICGGDDSVDLSASSKHTYHGARYPYSNPAGIGGVDSALTSTGDSFRSGDQGGDDHADFRTNGNGKRPRDDCNKCKDPTANIKPSPNVVKHCQLSDANDGGPVYEYKNKGTKQCPVTAVVLGKDGTVTYCFKGYGTPKSPGSGPRNEGIADTAISGKSKGKCPGGTKWAVDYEPVSIGGKDSSRVDLSPFAAANSTVLIPATVSGSDRAGSDDRTDFKFAWEQLRQKNPSLAGKSDTALNNTDYAGYTWHHNKVVEKDGKYYYEMILVPTTLHETAPHAGGSSWLRNVLGSGGQQAGTTPDKFKPPTGGTDVLKPRPGKPPNC